MKTTMDNAKNFSYIDPRRFELCPDRHIRNLPDAVYTFPKGPCPRCNFVKDYSKHFQSLFSTGVTIAASIQDLVGQDCWGVSILHSEVASHTNAVDVDSLQGMISDHGMVIQNLSDALQNEDKRELWNFVDEHFAATELRTRKEAKLAAAPEQTTKPCRTFLYANYQHDCGYVNDGDDEPFEFIDDYRRLVCDNLRYILKPEDYKASVSCIKTTILRFMRPGDILELWMFPRDGFMVEYHNLHQNLSATVEHGFNNGDVKVNYCKDYVHQSNLCVCKKIN